MLDTVFHQWDPKFRGTRLGFGPATFWGGGCVLFSIVHAARACGASPALDPLHANEMLRKAKAFDRDELRIHDAAPVFGMEAPLDERYPKVGEARPDDDGLSDALINCEGFALLRVHLFVEGVDRGGHTVFAHDAIALEGGALELEVADSASAKGCERIAWPDLTGDVRWTDKLAYRYRVVSVRPIRRKAQLPSAAPSTP